MGGDGPDEPSGIDIGETRPEEIAAAVDVVARAMSTSPLHLAAWREPDRAYRSAVGLFTALYRHFPDQRPLVARMGGRVVASTNDLLHDGSRVSPMLKARLVPALLAGGPGAVRRVVSWTAAWERADPDRPHSHYGPFGVDPSLQGRGLGSLMLAEYTRRLDERQEDAYLETDKPENVRLYERFGFEVTGEANVIGVPNWFMWRDAAPLER